VRLIGEPIEHSLAEPCVGEDLGPLGEGQVGGDDDGGLLGSLCDDLEQQLGSDLGQWNVAKFIDDDQFHAGPAGQHAAQTLLPLCFDELVDERGGGREANSPALTTGSDRQAGGEMTLAGTGRYRNIMLIVRETSRFTTSGTRYVGRIYVSADVCSCHLGSTSLVSFPMEPLVASPHGWLTQ
jgi:hypothetical protein